MGTKPRARRYTVLIDHPQITPSHKLRIVVTSERKTMERLQPTVVGVAAIEGFANSDHGLVTLMRGVPIRRRHITRM